jgi:predicted transcriptional regulator
MESRHRNRAVGIASPKEMRERLLAAARGESRPATEDAKVWMSLETLARLLTTENRKLLSVLAQERPRSVSALAERLDRDQGNVSRALGRLVEAGFVRLVAEGREKRPEVVIDRLRIDLDLRHDTHLVALAVPPPEIVDCGEARLGSSPISAAFPPRNPKLHSPCRNYAAQSRLYRRQLPAA